jgi:hypothetical protein
VYHEVITSGLSVRATEELVRKYTNPQPAKKKTAAGKLSGEYQAVQDNLTKLLGTKVQLKANARGKGQISIPSAPPMTSIGFWRSLNPSRHDTGPVAFLDIPLNGRSFSRAELSRYWTG